MITLWSKICRVGSTIVLGSMLLVFVTWAAQAASALPLRQPMAAPLTLAAYQVWHGLPSHATPPYSSTDPVVIAQHLQAAQARHIDGFVVDWYGPARGVPKDSERDFMDRATAELLRQAASTTVRVALMYDEGAVASLGVPTTTYTSQVITDLLSARHYYTLPGYLQISNAPALFVFAYDNVDPYVDWAVVRARLGITVTLFDKDPNPDASAQAHDAQFDGFYAWVSTPHWLPDGTDWGRDYLVWFYETMKTPPYTSKITVGGIWPGFDDSEASWGTGRYIWRRCGRTWHDTRQLAKSYTAPVILIDTWNDFEEGSDIEFGTGDCLEPLRQQSVLPGHTAVYTHFVINTGKLSDTFTITAYTAAAWPLTITPPSVTLQGHLSSIVTVTLDVPYLFGTSRQVTFPVTATSWLSPQVYGEIVNTVTIGYGVYLPLILKS